MAKTIVALYPTAQPARDALDRLNAETAIDFSRMSVIAHNVDREFERLTHHAPHLVAEHGNMAAEGAGAGATTGAVVGGIAGLLVGLGVFAIPGIGPVVAAGPLVSTLVGAGAGAAAGGVIGALVGLGVPEHEAHYYAEGVRRGGALLVVHCSDDQRSEVEDILEEYRPLDIEEAARRWRDAGWAPGQSAEPYADEHVRRLRAGRATAPSAHRESTPEADRPLAPDTPRVRPDELPDSVDARSKARRPGVRTRIY